jgi:hydroxypyruvate isomerase
MIRFSANISMLFQEVGFLDRFEKASAAGFDGVEFLFPYEYEKARLAEAIGKSKLPVVLHNLPAGDWEKGERGIACLPDREEEFRDGVDRAISYAKALHCPRLNCLVGKFPEGESPGRVRQTLVRNLRHAATALDTEGIRLLIEPLNHIDVPGFYLVRTRDALSLMDEVNHPNLQLQYDVYHMQIMEGNLIRTISDQISRIGHIQIADNPGRHEPGTGEINYGNVFKFLSKSKYNGFIGCEYKPTGTTEEGLGWIAAYKQ